METDSAANSLRSPTGIDHARFLAEDFSPLAYAQQQLASASEGTADDARFTHVLAQLQSQAAALERQAQATVQREQTALLEQIVGVRGVDSALSQAEEHVREIKAYMHTLRARIRVPHSQAAAYARQAGNLQAAAAGVRAVARFTQLARRLRTQMADALREERTSDWAAAAQTLGEIARTPLPAGVTLVEREMHAVDRHRVRVQAAGQQLIEEALVRHSASDAAAGLHVLGALGDLGDSVALRVRRGAAAWAAEVAAHPMAPAAPWSDVAALVDRLLDEGLRVRTLERALAVHDRRRADGASAAVRSLLGDHVLAFWWRAAVAALAARLLAPAVRSTLAAGFPRLARALFPKLEPLVLTRLGGMATARGAQGDEDPGVAVLWDGLLAPLAAQYVDAAAARMRTAVARCCVTPGIMDPRSASAAARCIAAEVHLAAAHVRLGAAVVAEAERSVRDFVHAAGTCITDASSGVECAAVVDCVAALRVAVRDADARLGDAADPAPLVERVHGAARDAALEAIANDDLAALEEALLRVQEATPTHGDVQPLFTAQRRHLVDRVQRAYVCAALLSFPLTEDVKLRVVGDVARVEFACSQLVALEGDAHAALRLLRPMLFMTAAELASALEGRELACVPAVDLASYVACRVVTDAGGSGDASVEAMMPWRLLGCSREQLRRRLVMGQSQDADDLLRAQQESLESLAAHAQQQPQHSELVQLATAAIGRLFANAQ